MNFLKNVPFWVWFISVTLVCYAVWNPTEYSLYGFWTRSPMAEQIFLKLTISFVVATIIFFFLVTTLQTIGTLGVVIYLIFIGLIIGLLHEQGWLNLEDLQTAQWWGQPLAGLMLTIGLLFSKIRFAITGIRTTDDVDDE